MRTRIIFILSLILSPMLVTNLLPRGTALAQGVPVTLTFFQPISAQIDAKTPSPAWTFSALKDQRVAARIQVTSGDLQPQIDIVDGVGTALATSQVSTLGTAVIEMLRIPRDGAYTLRATAKAGTGAFTVQLLPAYGALLLNGAITPNTPIRLWRETKAAAEYASSKLRLSMSGNNRLVYTSVDSLGTYRDIYMQVEIEPEISSTDIQMGIVIRGMRRGGQGSSPIDGYQLMVNDKREWQFLYIDSSGTKYLQPWTRLLAPEEKQSPRFTLGILAVGDAFTLFYNDMPQATLTDSSSNSEGEFGLLIGNGQTGQLPNNAVAASFNNLRVTVPAGSSNATAIDPPLKLARWEGNATDILDELRATRLIPFAGRPNFTTTYAFVSNSTPGGIVLVPLAQSQRFADVVYAAEFGWNSNNENVACALELRIADDRNFIIVYLDRKSGFGLRQFVDGDSAPTVYDLSKTVRTGDNDTNRVLVIAMGNNALVYINGQRLIYANVLQRAGSIAIAAYNYSTAQNYCQFRNIWLRVFDGQ